MNQHTQEALERFREEFGVENQEGSGLDLHDYYEYLHEEIESFLQSELQSLAEKVTGDLETVMNNIVSNDKTPRYPYHGSPKKRENARGEIPETGRWLTPSEIAENYLKHLTTQKES